MSKLKDVEFKKSSFSPTGPVTYCVSVGRPMNGTVLVKQSQASKSRSVLVFTKEEWRAFIEGVKAGEFDV